MSTEHDVAMLEARIAAGTDRTTTFEEWAAAARLLREAAMRLQQLDTERSREAASKLLEACVLLIGEDEA